MGPSPQAIRALLFEDNRADAFLFESLIADVHDVAFQTQIVASLADGLEALDSNHFDLILLDLHLPDSDGLETFDLVHVRAEDSPIIILSGLDDDAVASEAIRRGAQDFLIKGTLEPSVFIRTLRHAIERFKLGKLHDEIQRAQIELAISKKATHHFLSNVSHELVTPLTASLGFLQLLGQNPSLNDRAREHLKKAVASNEKLHAVVHDVIEMSKIQANQLEIENADFDFAIVWEDIKRRYEEKAADKGLSFIGDIDDIEILRGDHDKMAYIIAALVDNAIKFTEKGLVEVRIRMIDGTLHIIVSDTGGGIPESDRIHAWEAFQTDPDYLSKSGKSMGLGLPITHHFVSMMGGDISLQSDGQGTTVTVQLPNMTAAEVRSPDRQYDGTALIALRQLPAEPLRRMEEAVLRADPESFQSVLRDTVPDGELAQYLKDSMTCFEFDHLLTLFAHAIDGR